MADWKLDAPAVTISNCNKYSVRLNAIGQWENKSITTALGCEKVGFSIDSDSEGGFDTLVIFPDNENGLSGSGARVYTIGGDVGKTLRKHIGKRFFVHIGYFPEGRTVVKEAKVALSTENEVVSTQDKDLVKTDKPATRDDIAELKGCIANMDSDMIKAFVALQKDYGELREEMTKRFDALTSSQRYTQQTISTLISEWRKITNG